MAGLTRKTHRPTPLTPNRPPGLFCKCNTASCLKGLGPHTDKGFSMSQPTDPRLQFDFPVMIACDSLPSFAFGVEQNTFPLDMTGAEIEVITRAGEVIYTWSTPDTLTILDGVITAAPVLDTSPWPFGDHRYNLKIITPDGQKRSIARGAFTFLRR